MRAHSILLALMLAGLTFGQTLHISPPDARGMVSVVCSNPWPCAVIEATDSLTNVSWKRYRKAVRLDGAGESGTSVEMLFPARGTNRFFRVRECFPWEDCN